MNHLPQPPSSRYHPLLSLIFARVREFLREPEAVFWVYVFPLVLVVALGAAFRNRPVGDFRVAVQDGTKAAAVCATLNRDQRFQAIAGDEQECWRRLRTGRADLVIVAVENQSAGGYAYHFDPTRAESVLARQLADDALQRAAGRQDVAAAQDHPVDEPGDDTSTSSSPACWGWA